MDGWVDAGSGATLAAGLLADDGRPWATFDVDRIYDYRARRPTLGIVDGVPSELTWPELQLVHRRFAERDVLVLTGPEPDYRWRHWRPSSRSWRVRSRSRNGSAWAPSPPLCRTPAR